MTMEYNVSERQILKIIGELEATSFGVGNLLHCLPVRLREIVLGHKLVSGLTFENPNQLGSDGKCVKTTDGRYQLFCDNALQYSDQFRQIENKAELSRVTTGRIWRARFTLAHEFGHVFLNDESLGIRLKLSEGRERIRPVDLERFCDEFANALLMPRYPLQELCDLYKDEHPIDAIRRFARIAEVNNEPLVRRLARTGITGEYPWFVGIFRFVVNPHKTEPRRWRLIPRCLLLPRGIRCSNDRMREWNSDSKHNRWVPDPGHWYVGMDTLGFCEREMAETPDYRAITNYFSGLESKKYKQIGNDPNNQSLGGFIIPLKQLQLKPEAIFGESYQVAETLLAPRTQWPYGVDAHDLNSRRWAIVAKEPRAFGYHVGQSPPTLLLGARLALQMRTDKQDIAGL